jgi:hypothetical protein
VAVACNSSYSGGRDQEDRILKSPGQIVLQDPILKNPSQIGLVEWLKAKTLSSSPSTEKKKKKEKKKDKITKP